MSESPTQARSGSEKLNSDSSRKIRAESPGTKERKGARGERLRGRRSRRNNNPSLDKEGSHDDPLPSYSQLPVPQNWTTVSGKFNPNRSELGFDAKSNMAINVNSRYGCEDSLKSGVSKSSHSNTSGDTVSKMHNKSKGKKIFLGEIEDPVERHRFYKSLKKAGIKKTFTFDQDWENTSSNSEVSELSTGNASYILDLAQQKETRKKDREEEALEEALELYGTWLTEGKSDDKNIFLMILHEVKKEQKAKYKKADKRHSALLDAALDEELKRREKLKEEEEALKEEEEKEAKAEREKEKAKIMPVRLDPPASSPGMRSRKSRQHANPSQSKINLIIEHETSQRIFSQRKIYEENDESNGSKDGSDASEEVIEVIDVAERCTGFGPEGSNLGSSRNVKKSGFFSCMNTSLKDVTDTSHHRRKEDASYQSSITQPVKEDSTRMFSRLRRTLSERQAEQWKEEEKSWKKNNHVETKEEQWWKKINDAKRENELFDQRPASIDLTTRTAPMSTESVDQSKKVKLDLSTRTDPGKKRGGISTVATGMLPPVEEKKKLTSSKKKKSKKASELDKTEDSKEKKKKKKKKNEKKLDDPGNPSSTPDDSDALKTPKKKKKKDSEEKKRTDGGRPSSMKKSDTFANESIRSARALAFADETSVISGRSSKGKKNKKKDFSSNNSASGEKKEKKKVNKGEELASEKITKSKKKKIPSSIGSSSEDAVIGDSASLDWTHRCIMKTRSETTNGSETVLTMETALQ